VAWTNGIDVATLILNIVFGLSGFFGALWINRSKADVDDLPQGWWSSTSANVPAGWRSTPPAPATWPGS
jgi:hypothetical protein